MVDRRVTREIFGDEAFNAEVQEMGVTHGAEDLEHRVGQLDEEIEGDIREVLKVHYGFLHELYQDDPEA